MSTETELRDWRHGSTNAERLCAGILGISGFVDIDPQAPIGGPDDKKDILARRDGGRYVGAVYFPATPQSFTSIKEKFLGDRQGVERHDADGFVFLVNQPLTLGQRKDLQELGEPIDEIFHLERLRLALDSPQGYGLRLQFLGQAMTPEEQISFFSTLQEDLTKRLLANQRTADSKLDTIIERTNSIASALGITQAPSSSLEEEDIVGPTDASMSDLTIATLQLIHRALTDSSPIPAAARGTLRGVRVWIGDPNVPIFEPPDPSEVPEKLADLLRWWREIYPTAGKAGVPAVIPALARLHYGLVAIHPFLDANGRLARFVTDQGARELLGRRIGRELTADRQEYFEALLAGNQDDLAPLEHLLRAALT